MLSSVPARAATTITVDTTDGFGLLNDNCSLLEALNSSNNDGTGGVTDECEQGSDPAPDVIEFDIQEGAAPHTIAVTQILPSITEAVIIDGTSEPDYVDTPVVALDGSALGGSGAGLLITTGAGSTIKGLAIHSFGGNGITMSSTATGNTIQGNHLGTDPAGTSDLGNGDDGIGAFTSGNQIGGDGADEGNLVSGNGGEGIDSLGGNTIQGNLVGTDVTGTVDMGNDGGGIAARTGDVVGGTGTGAGNVVSGNGGDGISISGDGVDVVGNSIGSDAAGSTALGNDGNGVRLNAFGEAVEVGGAAAGAGNIIAFNGEDGISTLSNTGVDNPFVQNAIHDNEQLGIDLGNDGVTQNDTDDLDPGANNLQNFPVITSVTAGPTTTVNGTLDTDAPDTFFRLEFFVQDVPDPSQFGEGETFLGSGEVETDNSGDATFSIGGLGATSPAQAVTATATELTASGGTPLSTSEFSEALYLCTVTGTGGDDPSLNGTPGDDVICALDGDDTINGSPGDDIIIGGEGDDEISYAASPVALDIDLAAGTTTAGVKNDTLLEIEDATGGTRNDILAGEPGEANDLDGAGGNGDTIDYTGNFSFGVDVDLGAEETTQDGENGADTVTNFERVTGSSRQDTLAGEPGVPNVLDGNVGLGVPDTVSYVGAPDDVEVDLEAQQTSDDGDGAIDTLVHMSNVTGSQFDDELTGDDTDNVLNALNGDDVMIGAGGDDTLAGGVGADIGDYSGNPNGITADLPAETVEGGSTDTLFAVEIFIGTPFDDTFVDDPGVDNTYDAGNGTDRISYAAAPGAVVVDLGAGQTVNDGDGGTDTFTSTENATGSASGDTITGDDGPNSLAGGAGGDTMSGEDGPDAIQGEGGNDTISGGEGDDDADGGDGDDTINGDGGNDDLSGDAGNDELLGSSGADTLDGGDGDDDLRGEDAVDTLQGGPGNDFANGGNDNDTVQGGDGDDTVLGEGGNDIVLGEAGSDVVSGGGGNDSADAGEGNDSVLGEGGDDLMLGLGGNDTLTGGEGNDTARGGGGKDTAVGQAGKDTLLGESGKDTLKGGGGKDTLKGGGGKDKCVGGGGKDKQSSCER